MKKTLDQKCQFTKVYDEIFSMDFFKMIAKEYYNHSSRLILRAEGLGGGRPTLEIVTQQNLVFKLQYLRNQVTM